MRCVSLISLLFAGCVMHIAPYHQKHRDFDQGEYPSVQEAHDAGSIYSGARGLLEDERAVHVGDVVVININETDSASHNASTNLSKQSSRSIGLSGGLVDLIQKAVPAMQLANLLGYTSSSAFQGAGSTQRAGTLTGSLPVRVRKVMPNSDLYVEGTKVVMVGAEEHHLYISGIVRRYDIAPDGTVSSSRVSDAEIEYTGRGDISDQQRPGFLHRALDKVNPL